MTVDADMFQLTRALDSLNVPDGWKAEIIEGEITLSPTRPVHGNTIFQLMSQFLAQLPTGFTAVTDVEFDFPGAGSGFAPDVAIIPSPESDKQQGRYTHDIVEFVCEVVSPESRKRDYEQKARVYTAHGIGYLLIDPYAAQCVLHAEGTEPARVPYGDRVEIARPFALIVNTAHFQRVG